MGLMTYEDAESFLNIKRNTLYCLVSEGRIPYVRFGPRLVRFVRAELEAWVAEHAEGELPVPSGETPDAA